MWSYWSIAFILYPWLGLKFTIHSIFLECLVGVAALPSGTEVEQSSAFLTSDLIFQAGQLGLFF